MSAAVIQATVGDTPSSVPLPHPTGPVTTVPANEALIRLLIPDQFGQVWFDGVQTTSIDTTRYYITSALPGNQSLRYDVRATFKRNGQTVSEERVGGVAPGQTTVVDFTSAMAAQTGGG